MESDDELVGPGACAACGHVFLPAGAIAICPRCHAAHRGRPVADGIGGPDLLGAWLTAHLGHHPVERAPVGFSFHRSAERLHVVSTVEAAATREGYQLLIEQGRLGLQHAPPYVLVWLAGFARSDVLARVTGRELGALGQLRTWPVGLALFAEGPALESLRATGLPAVVTQLGQQASALGLEPVRPLVQVAPGARFDDLQAPSSGERAVRCGQCGAPVELGLLGEARQPRCPYCGGAVAVPAELARELAAYAKRVFAHDLIRPAGARRLWERFDASGGALVLACVVCGAPAPHRLGAAGAPCAHCHAAVIPSAAKIEAGVALASAQADARRARAGARARVAQRDAQKNTRRAVLMNVLAFAGVGIAGAVAVVGSRAGLTGGEWMLMVAPQALVYGVVPAAIGLFLLRRGRRQARTWGPRWSAIADQLDGEVLPSAAIDAWLGEHGAAPLARGGMFGPTPARGGVAAVIDGRPVIVEGDLEADVGVYRSRYGQPWLRIWVAARWPEASGRLKTTSGVRGRRAELHAAGYDTTLRRGGLELRAGTHALARMREQPTTLAVNVPLLYEALALTRILSGRA